MQCPKCKRNWPIGTEQAVAIEKKGYCIACHIEADERICMEPYEFAVPPKKRESTITGKGTISGVGSIGSY